MYCNLRISNSNTQDQGGKKYLNLFQKKKLFKKFMNRRFSEIHRVCLVATNVRSRNSQYQFTQLTSPLTYLQAFGPESWPKFCGSLCFLKKSGVLSCTNYSEEDLLPFPPQFLSLFFFFRFLTIFIIILLSLVVKKKMTFFVTGMNFSIKDLISDR